MYVSCVKNNALGYDQAQDSKAVMSRLKYMAFCGKRRCISHKKRSFLVDVTPKERDMSHPFTLQKVMKNRPSKKGTKGTSKQPL